LNDSDHQTRLGPRIIPRSEHNISRANISDNALKVLYRLKNAGFSAFLVGGAVRDLLLGKHPKDFDLVTDAHPEQVKELFRNCRLIGRRFRLAHVRFGREIIEVATFRATGTGEDDDERSHADSGRILRDNVYGTIDEDIWRRDFTINSLYYNIADYSVWDYTTGADDVRTRTLRLIGDPTLRYREDPVRMLRAVRFAAKLGFEFAPEAAAPIAVLGHELRDVPAARLFEEILKLFQAGHAARSLELLIEHDLLQYLFPATAAILADDDGTARRLILQGLANTDQRITEDKPVTPMFLFAVLLWPPIKRLAERLVGEHVSDYESMIEACHRVVAEQQLHTSIPRRFSVPMKEILVMQRRFQSRKGPRAAKMLEHKRFRAAYDFMLLRCQAGEVEQEIGDWWTDIQGQAAADQSQAFGVKKKRRRSRRGRRGGKRHASDPTQDALR
jgi:poly(A) polymerase